MWSYKYAKYAFYSICIVLYYNCLSFLLSLTKPVLCCYTQHSFIFHRKHYKKNKQINSWLQLFISHSIGTKFLGVSSFTRGTLPDKFQERETLIYRQLKFSPAVLKAQQHWECFHPFSSGICNWGEGTKF